MDYSNHEDAAGASPWGSSPVASPQRQEHGHTRSESYGSSIDVPTSPQYGKTRSYDRPVSSAGDSVADDSERPDTAESVAIDPEQALAGHQQAQAAAAQPHQPEPQRYHPGGRGQQQQGSQYKLQAKITGLERTGRKDPILRFDVHVSTRPTPLTVTSANISLDQSPKVPNHPIQGCATNPF